MAWNDLISNVKKRVRRTIGRSAGEEVPVDRDLIGDRAGPPRLEQFGSRPLATPAADVYEDDQEMLFCFDVPGGTRDGATVVWNERDGLSVLVRGPAPPAGQVWAAEYEPADWYRAFALPDHVDGAKATSTIRDGVLTIRVPKRNLVTKVVPIRGD